MGEARHLDVEVRQQVGHEMGRGLPVHGGVDRQHHLGHPVGRHMLHESVEVEVVRPDAVERRQHTTQHMVAAPDNPGPFQRPKVRHGFDHHQGGGVASRVAADGAGIQRVDVAASRAGHDAVAGDPHGIGERRQQVLPLAHEMQRRPARRTRPKPRQTGQQLDQTLDLGPGDTVGHRRCRPRRVVSARAAAAGRP